MTPRLIALSFALVTIVGLATAGCDRTETSTAPITTTSPAGESTAPAPATIESRDEALVRVVHAVPAGAPVDVYAGDLAVFEHLVYKAVTSYRVLEGKRYAFAVRPAGMPTAKPLSSNTEGLRDGNYYTAFVLPGTGHGAHLRVVDDLLTSPGTGKAKVRVVHGSADAGELDLYATGAKEALFDGIDFQSVTAYREIEPVNGQLEIRVEGQATAVFSVANAHIEAGRFYTVVIVGNVRSTPKIEAFIIADAPTPARTTTR